MLLLEDPDFGNTRARGIRRGTRRPVAESKYHPHNIPSMCALMTINAISLRTTRHTPTYPHIYEYTDGYDTFSLAVQIL